MQSTNSAAQYTAQLIGAIASDAHTHILETIHDPTIIDTSLSNIDTALHLCGLYRESFPEITVPAVLRLLEVARRAGRLNQIRDFELFWQQLKRLNLTTDTSPVEANSVAPGKWVNDTPFASAGDGAVTSTSHGAVLQGMVE